MVLCPAGGGPPLTKSAAALAVARRLGPNPLWPALGLLGLLVPRALRDAVYDFVANHRYAWCGGTRLDPYPDPPGPAPEPSTVLNRNPDSGPKPSPWLNKTKACRLPAFYLNPRRGP